MPLDLVSMLIDAAKEVGTSVYVQHDPFAGLSIPLPPAVVGTHLDPFGPEGAISLAPLPPLGAAHCADTLGPELLLDQGGCPERLRLWDVYLLDFYPLGMRNPLGCEGLEFFDGVF